MGLIDDFIADLITHRPHKTASIWLLERRPHIFDDDEQFIDWKATLAKQINVDAAAIRIVGSSCCGFSLNPYKNYKIFDYLSDVDVAVISSYHFDVAWRTLRDMKSLKREHYRK